MSSLSLQVDLETFPLKAPFHITGYTMTHTEVITVTLTKDGRMGRGEASGVFYRAGEEPAELIRQIEAARPAIEAGIDREALLGLMGTGGARNAIDCALWDLEARLTGRPAWEIAGLAAPQPLLTTFTVGANDPGKMAADALSYTQAKAVKIKLTGQALDADRVRAVRSARPDVWLGVDANQGFTRVFLEQLLPTLVDARVQLVEQPFRVGQDAQLEGFNSPIPLAADESIQGLADLPAVVGRFGVVNIKLDKCGGLTEGLALAREARRLGIDVMVGNMVGTSLAMAPAMLVGQLCEIVDLDGPVLLGADRLPAATYDNGAIWCPEALWGYDTTISRRR